MVSVVPPVVTNVVTAVAKNVVTAAVTVVSSPSAEAKTDKPTDPMP